MKNTPVFHSTEETTDFLPTPLKWHRQLEQLQELLTFTVDRSPYFSEKYGNINLPMRDRSDLEKLPFMNAKDMLHRVPPEHLLTGKPEQAYVFTSGGTTGEPKIVYLTAEELHRNIHYHGKGYSMAGIHSDDVVGTFGVPGYLTSEFTVYLGLERTGCLIVPIGTNGDSERLLHYLNMFHVTTLLVMPSDVIPLIQYLERTGKSLSVPKIIYGGEKLYDSTKEYLCSALGITHLRSVFQSMDVGTIGFQCEYCEPGNYHVHDQLQLVEIVDEEGRAMADGSTGELVITNLQRRLMPVIRYQTGDLAERLAEPCPCGRTNARIRLVGRKGDILKVGGEQFFPQIFAEACRNISELTGEYQLIVTKERGFDKLRIRFELSGTTPETAVQDVIKAQLLKNVMDNAPKLQGMIAAGVVLPFEVELTYRNGMVISESSGKVKRICDLRC